METLWEGLGVALALYWFGSFFVIAYLLGKKLWGEASDTEASWWSVLGKVFSHSAYCSAIGRSRP